MRGDKSEKKNSFSVDKAYQAKAEAVEMRKDVALTTWIAVLVPGTTQHALLLQDGVSVS